MAKFQVQGLDEYAKKLQTLGGKSEQVAKMAVFDGAAVIAEAIKAGIKALPTDNTFGTSGSPVNGISNRQKADLINGFGLAPMKVENGYINTKAGFNGYGNTPTKKYPNGVPNQILARSIESGTSFRKKHPFIRSAVNSSKNAAIDAMNKKIDEEMRKEFK